MPKLLLTIAGALLILWGLLWAAQGSGLFPYPAESPMIDQVQWIWSGILLAIVGIVAILLAGRIGR